MRQANLTLLEVGANPIGQNVMLSSPLIVIPLVPTQNVAGTIIVLYRNNLPSGGTQRRVAEMLYLSSILLDPWLALSLLTRITRSMRNSWWTALLGNELPLTLLWQFSLEYRSSQPLLQIGLKKETAFTSNGRATTVSIIAVLAINHPCRLLLGRDDGVTIVGNTNRLRIHTIRINESPRDFHEQLEGPAGGLNPVIFLKSIPIPKKSTQMCIWPSLKYPVGDTRTGNWLERLYQTNFGCDCREAATRCCKCCCH
jgi:hypothetical protein